MTEDMSRPSLETIEEQALTLLDLIARRHPDDEGEPEHPRLITHVIYDLVEKLRAVGDVPVLLDPMDENSFELSYAGARLDSTTKIEPFGLSVETFGMKDDDGYELTPEGLPFEGRQPVVVMHP